MDGGDYSTVLIGLPYRLQRQLCMDIFCQNYRRSQTNVCFNVRPKSLFWNERFCIAGCYVALCLPFLCSSVNSLATAYNGHCTGFIVGYSFTVFCNLQSIIWIKLCWSCLDDETKIWVAVQCWLDRELSGVHSTMRKENKAYFEESLGRKICVIRPSSVIFLKKFLLVRLRSIP